MTLVKSPSLMRSRSPSRRDAGVGHDDLDRITEVLAHLGERTVDIGGGRDVVLDAEEPGWRRRQVGPGDVQAFGGGGGRRRGRCYGMS